MLQILFVDDESSLLNGLKRLLRAKRNEWNMEFADSAAKALELMQDTDFDVLVTDLRMPKMNGAELLKEVADLYPSCMRIVLSGEVGTSLVYETMGVAHRFLSKPISGEDLCASIVSSVSMKEYLLNKDLQRMATSVKTLPSIPAIYEELVDALKSPEISMSRIGEIIKKDVAMTAKILNVVNSAFFGLKSTVSDPVVAVNYIGIEAVKSLVISIQAFQSVGDGEIGKCIESVWLHSEHVAKICRKIADTEKMTDPLVETCYMTGLLHDIGQLVLALNYPKEFIQCREKCGNEPSGMIGLEQKVFGASHDSIGAYLLGLWNLDHSVIESVAYHHEPRRSATRQMGPLAILHVAEALVYGMGDAEQLKSRLDFAYLKEIGCLERLPVWSNACVDILEYSGGAKA